MTHWLEAFKAAEAARRQAPGRQKHGGPTAQQIGVQLEKRSSSPRSCAGCVFYGSQGKECQAGLYTRNVDVHNDCATSGMVWVRSTNATP